MHTIACKFRKPILLSLRVAKKKLDNRSFFGGILHVCYAPEFETVDDTREKLQERRKVIAKKTRGNCFATGKCDCNILITIQP